MARMTGSQKKLLQEPDEFLSTSQHIWLWVHENRDRALMIAGGIAAAIILGVSVKAYLDHSREKRAAALATAITRLTQAPEGKIPADVVTELAGVAERYAGSPEGEVARYFQAGALASAGETEKARQIYTALAVPGAKNPEIAGGAKLALAYLDLASGAEEQARSAFEALLKTEGAAVPRAQIMLEIAGIHEKQGRPADARRLYQELLAEHPDGSWAATAKERLRALSGQGPAAA